MSPNDVVVVKVRMLNAEYVALQAAAEEAGVEENDFVRRAIADEVVIAPVRKRGGGVFVKPRVGRAQEVVIRG